MKRGLEIATGTVVTIILALVILVIIIIFAQQQVTRSGEKLTKIEEEAEFAPDRCQSIIKGTFCADSCTGEYESFTSPTGEWKDCKEAGKTFCCRKKRA